MSDPREMRHLFQSECDGCGRKYYAGELRDDGCGCLMCSECAQANAEDAAYEAGLEGWEAPSDD